MSPLKEVMVRLLLWLFLGAQCLLSAEFPTVEAVIESYLESQGGADALEDLRSLKIVGEITIESQNLEFEISQQVVAPDKSFTEQDFPGLGLIREVLNGERGWEWHPITGERPLEANEIEDKTQETDLQRDLRLFELYETIELGEPEVIEGIETTQLTFTDFNGKTEQWFFKANGDLFQKIHTVSSGPDSVFESTDRFYDFQVKGRFRFPSRIKFINPSYVAELKITSCDINPEIDPAVFEVPAPILE